MGEIHMNFSFWPFLWFGLPGPTPDSLDGVPSAWENEKEVSEDHDRMCTILAKIVTK